jgi:hypothetical protein
MDWRRQTGADFRRTTVQRWAEMHGGREKGIQKCSKTETWSQGMKGLRVTYMNGKGEPRKMKACEAEE